MKRLLATVLTIIMTMGIMSVNTFAAVKKIDSTELTKNSSNRENVVVIVLGESENEHEVCIGCEPASMYGLGVPLKSLATFIDYHYDQKLNEIEINMTNGSRDITLNCFSKKAIVDGKEIELKWNIEAPANADSPYINAEDIEAVFSYDVACDFNKNVVVMTVTDKTPRAIISATDMETRLKELKEYGIFEGNEQGELNLDKEITRAEFCKVICAALGFYDEFEVVSEAAFVDVPNTHWAYKYIQLADELGLVCGVGDNRFCPDLSISEIDAIKIITSALGYSTLAEQLGGYPYGFQKCAERFNIKTETPDKAILREKVAEYLYIALDIPLMKSTGYDAEAKSYTYAIMDGTNGYIKDTLRKHILNNDEIVENQDVYIGFSSQDYTGKIVIITDLKKTGNIYEFKNGLNTNDNSVYIINDNTKIHESNNVLPLDDIKDGLYAQCWHKLGDEQKIELTKIEIMKNKPQGI